MFNWQKRYVSVVCDPLYSTCASVVFINVLYARKITYAFAVQTQILCLEYWPFIHMSSVVSIKLDLIHVSLKVMDNNLCLHIKKESDVDKPSDPIYSYFHKNLFKYNNWRVTTTGCQSFKTVLSPLYNTETMSVGRHKIYSRYKIQNYTFCGQQAYKMYLSLST